MKQNFFAILFLTIIAAFTIAPAAQAVLANEYTLVSINEIPEEENNLKEKSVKDIISFSSGAFVCSSFLIISLERNSHDQFFYTNPMLPQITPPPKNENLV